MPANMASATWSESGDKTGGDKVETRTGGTGTGEGRKDRKEGGEEKRREEEKQTTFSENNKKKNIHFSFHNWKTIGNHGPFHRKIIPFHHHSITCLIPPPSFRKTSETSPHSTSIPQPPLPSIPLSLHLWCDVKACRMLALPLYGKTMTNMMT